MTNLTRVADIACPLTDAGLVKNGLRKHLAEDQGKEVIVALLWDRP